MRHSCCFIAACNTKLKYISFVKLIKLALSKSLFAATSCFQNNESTKNRMMQPVILYNQRIYTFFQTMKIISETSIEILNLLFCIIDQLHKINREDLISTSKT